MKIDMKDDEKKPFYVGVRPCGCITSLMVDDEATSRSDVAAFVANMLDAICETHPTIDRAKARDAAFRAKLALAHSAQAQKGVE